MSNSSFGERLKRRRKMSKYSQAELSQKSGVSQQAISGIESGRNSPSEQTIIMLAKALGCSVAELMMDADNTQVIPLNKAQEMLRSLLTEDEYEELKLYQGAEPTYREVVKDVLRAHQREKKEPVVLTRSIPVFDSPAAAGTPLYAESSYEYMDFPISEIPKGTDFGVRISGESMQPTIKNGSIVFVKKTVELRNGEIGVFMLGDSAVCKRLKLDDQERVVALESDNAEYGSIKGHDLDGFRVVGRVLL